MVGWGTMVNLLGWGVCSSIEVRGSGCICISIYFLCVCLKKMKSVAIADYRRSPLNVSPSSHTGRKNYYPHFPLSLSLSHIHKNQAMYVHKHFKNKRKFLSRITYFSLKLFTMKLKCKYDICLWLGVFGCSGDLKTIWSHLPLGRLKQSRWMIQTKRKVFIRLTRY